MGRRPGVPQLYKRDGSDIYWARFTVNGTRHRFSTGTGDDAKARKAAEQEHARAALGRTTARIKRHTISEATGPLNLLFAEYINWASASGDSAGYIVKQEMHYRAHFSDFWQKLNDITGQSIERYKVSRIQELPNPECTTSVYKELVTLSQFLRWCKKAGHIDAVPEFDRFVPETNYIPLDITRTEVNALLAALPDRKTHPKRCPVREFFTVQWAEAMRPGEVMALRWQDVDFATKHLAIRKDKAKTGRVIALAREAETVFAQLAKEPHIQTSLIFGRTKFRTSLRIAAKKVGIDERITPHHLRHARLSELGGHTRDVAALQFFAGHKNLSTTDIYVRSRTDRTTAMLDDLNSGTKRKFVSKKPAKRSAGKK